MSGRYTTILLDLDHTLLDSDASEAAAFRLVMEFAGVADSARHIVTYQEINRDLWTAVERGELTPQDVRTRRFEQFGERMNLKADPHEMADVFVQGLGDCGDLYVDSRDVLEHLHGQVTLALVTNGLSEVQRRRIERLDIGQYFDAVIISAEIGAAKPGTEIFDHTFASLGFPGKGSALMVGDSLSSDIRGGSNYGIDTCWFNPHGKIAGDSDRVSHEIADIRQLGEIVSSA